MNLSEIAAKSKNDNDYLLNYLRSLVDEVRIIALNDSIPLNRRLVILQIIANLNVIPLQAVAMSDIEWYLLNEEDEIQDQINIFLGLMDKFLADQIELNTSQN